MGLVATMDVNAMNEMILHKVNEMSAAEDNGHLTPGQKAYIQAKEDAQAAKQQLAKDAQDKALQERAVQLADAGKAMDVVRDGFTHKLGWLA